MNCKPGDLAVISRPPKSLSEIQGRIVKVLVAGVGPRGRATWTIDGRLSFVLVGNQRDVSRETFYVGESVWMDQVEDGWLTPIRDSDAEDETLTWAGKPVDVHAPIERLTPGNPLPHAVGGDPMQTWPDESTAWEGIQ